MNIIYSPNFNSTSYLALEARQISLLGTKVCGTKDLLSELELRAGIVGSEMTETECLVKFCEAMESMPEPTLFTPSFLVDKMRVARQLLSWIDQLLLMGWNPGMEVHSEKLKTLSKILLHYKGKTEADRWKELVDYAKDHRILDVDDTIEVHIAADYLPPMVHRLLVILENQASIKYVQMQKLADVGSDLGKVQRILLDELSDAELNGDGTFDVYHFKTRKHAYEWYLAHIEEVMKHKRLVVVNHDNCLLNDLALSMGMPMVHSVSTNCNPQLLQLFKLGLSLFVRPLNINHLLSYLQVPGNPLGAVSHLLARVLVSEGGIGELWKETLNKFDFTDAKGKDRRKEKLNFIQMVDKEYDLIPVSEVVDFINHLAHWAQIQQVFPQVSDIRKEQLIVLSSYCHSLKRMLLDKEFITSDELTDWVDGIYQSQSFTHACALKGAPDVMNSLCQLVDGVDVLYWLDCVGGELTYYPFDFLNIQEVDELKGKGINLPSKSEFYFRLMKQQQQALLKVHKQLVLVSWDYDENHPQDGNPIAIGLKSKLKGWDKCLHANEKVEFETEEKPIELLDIQKGYSLDTELLNGFRRTKESNTSIQKMIQYPFDYVSDYLMALSEQDGKEFSNLDITKGKIAHRYIEHLFEEFGDKMVDGYHHLSEDERNKLLGRAIREKGAILLLPEYKLELHNFSKELFQSVSVLFEIIQQQKLIPQGCEVLLNVELDGIGAFEAYVDMVLRNVDGNLVIFDFKWSKSSSYVDALVKNKSIQLELYKQAAMKFYNGKKVAGVAYYLFPLQKLYSCDFEETDHIVSVKRDAEGNERMLFEEICASYQYRREELDKGWIEQAELMLIEETDYGKETLDKGLYPLVPDYNQKTVKSCPFVKDDKPFFSKTAASWKKVTEPREIKTTHSILKGRLS